MTRSLTLALDPGQDSRPRSTTICVTFAVLFISLSLGFGTCVTVLILPPSGCYDLLSGAKKRQTGGHQRDLWPRYIISFPNPDM